MLETYRLFKRFCCSLKYVSTIYPWMRAGLLLCCILMAFSSCENTANTQSPGPWPSSLAVTFAASISYEHALRLITDLGLQPAMDCAIGSKMLTPGTNSIPRPQSQPMGQRDSFLHEHRLLVYLASPPFDWFKRLKATPGVRGTGFLAPKDGVCHAVVYGTPP